MPASSWTRGLIAAGSVIGQLGQHSADDKNVHYVQPFNPHAKWRYNWDNKEKEFLRAKYRAEKKKMPITIARRNIFLVRQGHGFEGPDECAQELSCLGTQQAELVGERLKELKMRYTSITFADNSNRGFETSRIIRRTIMRNIPVITSQLVRSGHPIQPEPEVVDLPIPASDQILEDGERIEMGFNYHFYRPDPDEITNSYDIIVCPSNVLRYFVCRVLQFPPEAWQRFTLFHCSITWIMVDTDGGVGVVFVGDFGHLPPDKLTT